MPDLGTAYVNIVPKAPGISGKIEEVLGGGSAGAEKAGAGFGKKLVAGLAAAGVGVAIGNVVKQAFEAGGNLQQSFGGLETIYGKAAEGAKKYAQEAAAAGISANTYAEQAVSMGAALKAAFSGDTTKAAEAANQAIMDMADNAAKMGTPIESLQTAYQGFAKGNYTMLDNLKLGYGGTKTEMARLLADAQKISGVKYDMSNLGDVYSAIHVIQQQLGLTGVAADEAKTTLTGSIGAMKASWENLMGALTTGEGLDTAMAELTESVGNVVSNVVGMAGTLAQQLPAFLLGLMDVAVANAPALIKAGADLAVNLAKGLVSRIPEMKSRFVEALGGLKDSLLAVDWLRLGRNVLDFITNGIRSKVSSLSELGRTVVGPAIRAVLDYIQTVDWVQLGSRVLTSVVNGVKATGTFLIETIGPLFNEAWAFVQSIDWMQLGQTMLEQIANGIIAAGSWLIDNFGPMVTAMTDFVASIDWVQLGRDTVTWIGNGIKELWSWLLEMFEPAITALGDFVLSVDWPQLGMDILTFIGNGIISLGGWILGVFKGAMNSLFDLVGQIDWAQLGKDIINGIIAGLAAAASWLYDSVRNIITNALGAGRDEAEVGSPSRLFARELGRWIPAGVAVGAEENMDPLDKAMQQMIDGSLSAAEQYTVPAAGARQGPSDADRIIAALRALKFESVVVLDGDAAKLFKVIKSTNNTQARAATFNPLGARV